MINVLFQEHKKTNFILFKIIDARLTVIKNKIYDITPIILN